MPCFWFLTLSGILPAMQLFSSDPTPKPQLTFEIPENTQVLSDPMPCLSAEDMKARNLTYCPAPSSLVLNKTSWSAPGNWKSYQVSFIKHINRFLGAQWTGIHVGRMICLYGGDNPNDFPVQLVLPTLAQEPTLPIWEPIKNNSSNCISTHNQVCDCPIQIFIESNDPDDAKAAVNQISQLT